MKLNKKTLVLIITLLTSWTMGLNAQEQNTGDSNNGVPQGYEVVDSLVYTYAVSQDELLSGKNILDVMPNKDKGDEATVIIEQSDKMVNAYKEQIRRNSSRKYRGYRVRIYFDNGQNSREESGSVLGLFVKKYRGIKAYREFEDSYYKVAVGNCRDRSEARAILELIKKDFPSAFIIRDYIKYPFVDPKNAYDVDTVKVLRPVPPAQSVLID